MGGATMCGGNFRWEELLCRRSLGKGGASMSGWVSWWEESHNGRGHMREEPPPEKLLIGLHIKPDYWLCVGAPDNRTCFDNPD